MVGRLWKGLVVVFSDEWLSGPFLDLVFLRLRQNFADFGVKRLRVLFVDRSNFRPFDLLISGLFHHGLVCLLSRFAELLDLSNLVWRKFEQLLVLKVR